eukprot:COSAG01_NODE_10077_length_2255_cov_1.871521_5_plen_23_part_01
MSVRERPHGLGISVLARHLLGQC